MIAQETLRAVAERLRPALERQYEDRRTLNGIFMRAWRAGALDEAWAEFRKADTHSLWLTYFIRARGMGDIKIGKSNQVRVRLRSLFTGASRGVDLVACYPAPITHEKELHTELRRSRLCGEWFRADEDVLDHLRSVGCDTTKFTNVVPAHFYRRFPEQMQ